MTSKKIATVKKLALRFLSKTGMMQMITSAFLERAQSTRNSPKKMCPPSKKSLFTLAVRVRYEKVLYKDWKVSEYCPAGDWCNRWTFCTVVQHTAPRFQILPSSVLPSFAFYGTSFLSMETNGQLLVHCIGSAEGRASKATCIRGFLFSSVEDICRLVMKSAWWHFDKAPISSLAKFWQDVHFQAFTLLFCRLHLHILDNGCWTKGVTKKITRKVNSD